MNKLLFMSAVMRLLLLRDKYLVKDEHFFDNMATKSCVNIFIKNHKSTNPGANKVVYGPCEQETDKKNAKF